MLSFATVYSLCYSEVCSEYFVYCVILWLIKHGSKLMLLTFDTSSQILIILHCINQKWICNNILSLFVYYLILSVWRCQKPPQ